MTARRRLLPFALLLAATGCVQNAPVPPGGTMHLAFAAGSGVNPGRDGAANPVQVRVYSLKNKDRFLNADYFQLAEKDKAVLGDDLLFRQDITLRPGAKQTVDSVVLPGQQSIGLSVGFRDIDHATWRTTAPLNAQQSFDLDGSRLVMQPIK